MKHHFFFPYFGNKRSEVEIIYKNINFENIEIIVEPFCGSCAMSYYIAEQQPKKFKYILNDNDEHLINFMKIIKDKKKTKAFQNKINKLIFDKDNNFINKENYIKIINKEDIYSWFIKSKYYSIRSGLYPLEHKPKNKLNLEEYPMINFLRNENVILLNEDGCTFLEKYKDNKNVFLFFDPPYMLSNNGFYKNPKSDIYKIIHYFIKNKILLESKILFCLEFLWIIELLFSSWNIIKYDKKYETSKKKTEHCIIKNF